jgi:hypothetical protein
MSWHSLINKAEFDRAVQAERRRAIEKGYDAAHDDEHGVAHLRRWRDSYASRGFVIAAAALDIAIEEHLARLASQKPAEPVHWSGEPGEGPTSLHGNGASSFVRTSGDEDEVTCKLCLTLLARESAVQDQGNRTQEEK